MPNRLKYLVPLIAFCCLLCACGSDQPATATPTATSVPLPTATWTPPPVDIERELQSSPYLYRLTMTRCEGLAEGARYQTAFKMEGVAGLVTALHGVAGCANISALRADQSRKYTYLQIVQFDAARDIAVIADPTQPMDVNEGIRFVQGSDMLFRRLCGEFHADDPQLFILGYPDPHDRLAITRTPYVDCVRPLNDRVPIDDLRFSLENRGISMATEIYDVQDVEVIHGHSGSPLLMYDSLTGQVRVLGVIIGRLLKFLPDGTAIATNPNGWAVVLSGQSLVRVEEAPDQLGLAPMDVSNDYNLAVMFAADSRIGQSPDLRMVAKQEWSSAFTIQRLFTPQDSCVAIYSGGLGNSGSVRLALAPFSAGENGSGKKVGAVWDIPESQIEQYRQFCSSLSQMDSIELYAYLVLQEQGDCSEHPVQQAGQPVEYKFSVSIPADATGIGVCSAFQ